MFKSYLRCLILFCSQIKSLSEILKKFYDCGVAPNSCLMKREKGAG